MNGSRSFAVLAAIWSDRRGTYDHPVPTPVFSDYARVQHHAGYPQEIGETIMYGRDNMGLGLRYASGAHA